MANSYIDFTCRQQALTLPDPPIVAEGASVLYARFDLCPKWDGLALYARFKNMAAVYDVPISDGCALIPWEVVKYTGFEVSIFGEDAEGGRLTSAKVFVDVKRGIDFDGAPPIQATPTLIQVFEAKVQNCIDISAAVRADAEAGAFDGDPFTVSAIYSSVAEMEADASGAVAVGKFAVIDAGTVDDPDNAKLYQRTAEGWRFIVDMSGASGSLDGVGSGQAGQVLTMQADGTPAWNDAPETGTKVDFPILVNQGGTGATNAQAARANLDVYSKSEVDEMAFGGGSGGFVEHEHSADDITSGLLPIAYGGTGANTAAGALVNLGIEPRLQVLEKPEGRVLWSGMAQMGASQTITLSEAVSAQPNGIMLIFSRNDSDTYFHCVPVSKEFVARHSGCSISVPLITNQLFTIKAVYMSDTSIMGDSRNESESFTLMDKTVSNKHQCLRYVIGY